MKAIAIALGTLATVVAPAVVAQYVPRNSPEDLRRQELEQRFGPTSVPADRAHLSIPGERPWYEEPGTDGRVTTPDVFVSRNRDRDFRNDDRFRERRWERMECWNPRARHYEEVRPHERQDDLDFSRCRPERFGR